MKNGLYINKEDSYLERFIQKTAELTLLGRGDGSEVMLQTIDAKRMVVIEPSDISETMEFFYILEGELEICRGNYNTRLKKGEQFYVRHLKETIQFDTITDVKLLYFTTKPVFRYISTKIRELTELATKVEEKDLYTFGHIDRVKSYSLKIGNKLKLSKVKMETLGFAAIFHDLGKINISDELLNKSGKLTDEEYDLIKKHSSDGAELVKETYYENISDIIEQHHEKIDGSGYPFGLKGDQILIEAKVISVADTYDAITTDRPYRNCRSPQKAIDELLRLKGIHYDIDVVDAFIEILIEDGIISSNANK